jgi:cytochrome d ubiquinol oxidase subunit II
MILTALYLPVAIMLFGLILRGVAFEFRAKVNATNKIIWNRLFVTGSLITALSQGFMLGFYIMGLKWEMMNVVFSLLIAICLTAAYVFIGACWLILKMEGELQLRAVAWAKKTLAFTVAGMGAVSLATPWVSPRIFERWFSFPEVLILAPLPIMTAVLFLILVICLRNMPFPRDQYAWAPLALTAGIFVLGFAGMAYSFYPYVVPEQLTIYEAAAAPESLFIILIGGIMVLPVIIGYSIYAYIVFGGKASELRYD